MSLESLLKRNIDDNFSYSIKEAKEKKEYFNSLIKSCELMLMKGELINLEEVDQLIESIKRSDISINKAIIYEGISRLTQEQINLLTN